MHTIPYSPVEQQIARAFGKMSRPGKPIKNKTQLPVYIAFTFYPAVGYL
jgi:hypothetical protein